MPEKIDRRLIDDGRYANDRRTRRDRRQGPDSWFRSLKWFAITGWALVLGAFFMISVAKPRSTTFFARMNNLSNDRAWNMDLMYYVFWMLFAGIVVGLLGVVVNIMRRRRKHDVFYFSLLLLGAISIIAFFWVFTI
ncbi:MAG: hypothetical protein B6I36_04805 [Desulfobacteraceae bacterium 4572_35.1]|nr:MAG: hypothetical protein B6I36_04805 [Desulfobacteraceae bacterium 4572_35.1]